MLKIMFGILIPLQVPGNIVKDDDEYEEAKIMMKKTKKNSTKMKKMKKKVKKMNIKVADQAILFCLVE